MKGKTLIAYSTSTGISADATYHGGLETAYGMDAIADPGRSINNLYLVVIQNTTLLSRGFWKI
jgi:hypothetical protein